jgi:hypothetical protein
MNPQRNRLEKVRRDSIHNEMCKEVRARRADRDDSNPRLRLEAERHLPWGSRARAPQRLASKWA